MTRQRLGQPSFSSKAAGSARLVGLPSIQLCVSQNSNSGYKLTVRGQVADKGSGGNYDEVRTQCKQGKLKKALETLHNLEQQGYQGCSYTYVCLLQGCIQSKVLAEGKLVHAHIVKCGITSNIFIGTTLVNMYAQCGSMEDARLVFDNMLERNLFTWNIMIAACCKHGYSEAAFELFWQMQKGGLKPDEYNFVSILKACANIGNLEQGKEIHALMSRSKINPNVMMGNAVINMYAKCGSMKFAREMFDNLAERDTVTWTVMITGYINHGDPEEAMRLFKQMKCADVKPDEVTFLSMVKVCADLGHLEQAKKIHSDIKKSGIKLNICMSNALIDMYSKCGSLNDAWHVFHLISNRDVVTWNAMIAGLTKHGYCEEVFKLFQQMELEGVHPDQVTFVSVLNACATLGDLEKGKQIHSDMARTVIKPNIFVKNALIDMYAKCGSIDSARQLFDNMPERNVVSWNAMIVGYAKLGLAAEVLKLYKEMALEGTKPDEVTFVSILNACASLTALEEGIQMHNHILKTGLGCDLFVGNALIDMYAKCGRVENARGVLDKMPKVDVVSWNAMLAGYAQHGHAKEALQLVDQMVHKGVEPNHVTLLAVLSACSHAGLLDEGHYYFNSMTHDHGISPAAEHYVCMVDLLGRCGHLQEAERLIRRMPFEPSAVVWRALLGSCRIHGNMDLAIHAAECVLVMEPHDDATFLLLSNIYACTGRWDDQARVIRTRNERDMGEHINGSYEADALVGAVN